MIPFYRPYHDHRELLAALRPGTARREFESAVARRARARYGISFAYGRACLVAALRALGVAEAEVILPAYTCLVMAHAVVASGNRPVFADIDLSDYNMHIRALKRALTPRTRAVVATHMYGYLSNVDAIRDAVGDERVIIVEDAALSLHPLSSEGSGLRGDFGLFSFGAGKPLSTYEGGMLVTNSPDIYEKVRVYRDEMMNRASFRAWAKRGARFLASHFVFVKGVYDLRYWQRAQTSGDVPLEFTLPPDYLPRDIEISYPDFQARIGLVQLRKVDSVLNKRRALARLYDHELRGCPGIHPPPLADGATYAYYTLRIPCRDEIGFRQRMIGRGVAVDQVYDYALPYLPAYHRFAQGTYARAAQAAKEVVNLPCYPHLQAAEAQYIAACVRECAHEVSGAL